MSERNEVLHQSVFIVRGEHGSLTDVAHHSRYFATRRQGARHGRPARWIAGLGIEIRIEAGPNALADCALPGPYLLR
ncbi:MAG: hypothetical protein ABIR28_12570, partial [Vicinamibacteria bacterium]